jgi:hypothetical protein
MDDERRHLTGLEVEKLLAATKGTRNEARDRVEAEKALP